MSKILKISAACTLILLLTVLINACSVRYSTTGASIPEAAKTISVLYFPNRADIVNPGLSSEFTESLKDKFISQTKLEMISDSGDLSFEGEITQYYTRPAAISGDETASLTRLTIGIKVIFTNELEPDKNFESTFSHYEDFDADQSLEQVEGELIPQILEKIIEDIFNRAVVNW
jgi:hypothetical protein